MDWEKSCAYHWGWVSHTTVFKSKQEKFELEMQQ